MVAEALGLVAVTNLPGAPPEVPDHLARLVLYGEAGDLHRPVAAAVDQGTIMVTCGMDPWTGASIDQLDRYLAREHRLFMGRLVVHVASGR